MSGFDPEMTLRDARLLLREMVGDGEVCPCCDQFAKVYRRKISATMARRLRDFRQKVPAGEFRHLPTVFGSGTDGEFAKLRYWNLIEEEKTRRPDGGRSGYWKVTERGEAFLAGRETVPKYVHIYNGDRLFLSGDRVSFKDSFGEAFDYLELLSLDGGTVETVIPGERFFACRSEWIDG